MSFTEHSSIALSLGRRESGKIKLLVRLLHLILSLSPRARQIIASLVVDASGFIESIEGGSQTEEVLRARFPNSNIQILSPGCFLFPAFYDLHLHAPQFLYQGTGLHLPLMQWLQKYAFKAEERIDADPELARKTYIRLAKRLKEHGTGTVLLFGTIKERSK